MDDKFHIKNFRLVFVSNFVILDRHPIVEMFRNEPNPDIPFRGWCFLSGEEEKDEDIDLCTVESLLAVDSSVEPFLFEPVGTRFRRSDAGAFERVPFEIQDDDDPSA
jgi:hypothetical protein